MSLFIFSTALVSIILWTVWLYTLIKLPPNNLIHILYFLISLFFALATALSMILYRLALKGARLHHSYINPRLLMQHCFRRAGIISGVITVAASLKVLGAFSTFNFFLLILLAFFAEAYFMRLH